MKYRIKQIRQFLGLSQEAFGYNLGVSRSVINNLERGSTELKEPLYSHFCSVYNVNPDWLRTGEGEMFLPVDNSPLRDLQKQHNLSDKVINIIEGFVQLPRNEQEQFIETLRNIIGE